MTCLNDQIVDICRVLGFYAARLDKLRAQEASQDDLTRGYLAESTTKMAYRALSPWYKLADPLYAELEWLMQQADAEERAAILNDPEIVGMLGLLHQIRAAYEFDKERDEAERLLCRGYPKRDLSDLLAHQSYWIITRKVLAAIKGAKALAVIGSGPLPLTALALAQSTNAAITCYEADETGFELGKRIIKAAGLADRITCLHQHAGADAGLEPFDAVFCAVLLGVDIHSPSHLSKRVSLLGFLNRMNDHASVLIRDPFQLGNLFYPEAAFAQDDPIQIEREDPNPAKGEPYRSSFLILKKGDAHG